MKKRPGFAQILKKVPTDVFFLFQIFFNRSRNFFSDRDLNPRPDLSFFQAQFVERIRQVIQQQKSEQKGRQAQLQQQQMTGATGNNLYYLAAVAVAVAVAVAQLVKRS